MASIPSTMTDYEAARDRLQTRLDDSSRSPCDKFADVKATIVVLERMRGAYFSRPCLATWPCPWTQHRTIILNMVAELSPVATVYEKACAKASEKTAGGGSNSNVNHNNLIVGDRNRVGKPPKESSAE